MDINFHYFAVKVIAVMAGYNNTEADEIAAFSQYADDYFDSAPFRTTEPPPFQTPIYNTGDLKVYPVQTGIQTLYSISENHQRNVIVPFHFIPPRQLSIAGVRYRTTPAQWADWDNQLITQMIRTLLNSRPSHPYFRVFLGLLLHVFADTYAHQSFNGFHQKHINDGRVMKANVTYLDGSRHEKSYSSYSALPAIGHADLGTAPDETALTYTCMRDNGSGQMTEQPERVNAYVFLQCAHQILKILCAAKGVSEPGEHEVAILDAALGNGFLVDCSSSIDELCRHWQTNVPSINGTAISYGYNAQAIHTELFEVNAEKLPENITLEQVHTLLNTVTEKTEQEDELNAQQAAFSKLAELSALGAVKPTAGYYYFNTCAYEIRKLVNS